MYWMLNMVLCGDASKITTVVVLEINGKIAEDAVWLRKKGGFQPRFNWKLF